MKLWAFISMGIKMEIITDASESSRWPFTDRLKTHTYTRTVQLFDENGYIGYMLKCRAKEDGKSYICQRTYTVNGTGNPCGQTWTRDPDHNICKTDNQYESSACIPKFAAELSRIEIERMRTDPTYIS